MPDDQRRGASVRSRWPWWPLGAAVAAYLLSPVLFSQHLEGYTANLRSIAITWERGELATQDVIMPVITDYLFNTRIGIVLLLRLIDGVFGPVGDAGFRGLTVTSFAVLVACSVSVARRWGGVGLPAGLAACLLIPGLTDIGSFFNDNVVSAAFAVAALAAVGRSSSVPACAAAGALLGAAILCRTDAALLGPALAGIIWLQHARPAPLLGRGVAVLAGLLAVFAAAFALTGVSPLDVLRVTGSFFPPKIGIVFRTLIACLFLGAAALVLLCIGAALNVRQRALGSRDVRWTLVFLVYPALVAGLAVLRLSTEVRYIYPLLAPFCVMHVGRGLEWLLGLLLAPGRPRRAGVAVAAGLAVLLVLPPAAFVRDGPHSFVGRMWTPLLWHRWQHSVAQSLRQIDEVAAAAQAGSETLVLSTHFNDDFFLKLRLLERGFQVRPAESEFPECGSGFSVYAKPGHRVVHVRTDNQYGLVPLDAVVVRSLYLQRAFRCAALWGFDRAYLTFVGADARAADLPLDPALFGAVIPRLPPAEALSTSFEFGFPAVLHPSRHVSPLRTTAVERRMGDIRATPVTRAELEQIGASADRVMTESDPRSGSRPFTFEDVVTLYRRRS